MNEFIGSSSYFCITLTLVAYAFASAFQKKWKLAILNPILISAAIVMAVLQLLGISNEAYQAGCYVLNYLLTPATICLAISFYSQFKALKKHLLAVTAGVLAGTVCGIGSILLMSKLMGIGDALMLSLLPKSVTNAIGTALSQEIGGIVAVTTAAIAITGTFGNMTGPTLCKLFRLKNPIAQGVAFGTSAHVIGTAKAAEMSKLAGAVSSLALTLAGLVTCVILSFMTQFI